MTFLETFVAHSESIWACFYSLIIFKNKAAPLYKPDQTKMSHFQGPTA